MTTATDDTPPTTSRDPKEKALNGSAGGNFVSLLCKNLPEKGQSDGLQQRNGERAVEHIHPSARVLFNPSAGSPTTAASNARAPSPSFDADARRVVANPEQYADRPLLRRLAWITLMAGRGKVVDQNRLSRMPVEVGQ